MRHEFLAQAATSNSFQDTIIIYFLVVIAIFLISVFVVRAIFNIPTIVRLHKAQVRLLEEMAKNQGVDNAKVQNIIAETIEWDTVKQ